ncbi:uncharacterized protein LOC126817261 [Patella vulgata]|uniref:uncharacterized protein LOC126817261 n=1 Tax=Patella vulgata TaxID=6465 RepID=UPI00217F5289|nr:uncharacterized protein LOC126817261 [Patella vulgata]
MEGKMSDGLTMIEIKPPVHGHLGPGNFTISQEEDLTHPAMCSVFKKHYIDHPGHNSSLPTDLPALGPVMHRDRKFFNEMSSETSNAYEYRPTVKPVLENAQTKLSTTNFKMDKDLSKFNSFNTTSEYYFGPKVGPDFRRIQTITDHGSHVPNGDPGKAPLPKSDYRDKFVGHDTSVCKIIKAKSMHEGGPPTITGDLKYNDFTTSHSQQFPYKWQYKLDSFYPTTVTNVPNGDPEKIVLRDTTMRTSFPCIEGIDRPKPSYDRQAVSQLLLQTNFKQSDGKKTWDNYMSTANSSFQMATVPYKKSAPSIARNQSAFPRGDWGNDTERRSMTTSNLYHGNPAPGLHNTILKGADELTKSNVLFGEPRIKKPSIYYSTTTQDVFTPKSTPYTYTKNKYYLNSHVPLRYYKNEINNSTTQSDYLKPGNVDRVHPMESGEQMKKTNFFPPWRNATCFNTTHQDMYTPKTMEKFIIDSGKMQRSSVPLGPQA